jgi:hypothetical protein
MVKHLFPNFLNDPDQYRLSSEHWENLWQETDRHNRAVFGWRFPWVGTGSPTIRDGNPIFSADSPTLRRGIRIIQHEPTEPGLEIQAWLDSYGGRSSDPESIEELVIACALSDAASCAALSLMDVWIGGGPIAICYDEDGRLLFDLPPHRPMTSSQP